MNYSLDLNIQNELKTNNYLFSKATLDDLDKLLDLYKERTNWFKEKGIKQWSKYLEHHPKEEFIDVIENGYFFIIKEKDNIIGGFELSTNRKYLRDDLTDAYYIYKLVTKINYKNVGNCKNIAINNNKSKLRLDCLKNNERLNIIYENYGFRLIKTGYEDSYSYALREYNINNKKKLIRKH